MSKPQYDEFMQVVQDVIKADRPTVEGLLPPSVPHLGERFDAASEQPGTKSIRSLSDDVRQVLATAAYLGRTVSVTCGPPTSPACPYSS